MDNSSTDLATVTPMTTLPVRRRLATRLTPIAIAATAVAIAAAVLPAATALGPVPARATSSVAATPARTQEPSVKVGTLRLTPCKVVARALCGTLDRAWDPTGAVPGTVSVGFAFVPAKDTRTPARGTYVPHEGGPGYATTASGSSYVAMYGPLLRRHNLLLVDQRGTGRTAPIDCPELQDLKGAYAPAAATCAARLAPRAHLYGTALSADDLAAVVRALRLGKVDVYGDSYGTFFAQTYAGRHPRQVRSLVVDGAYPTYGENAWYATQAPTMRRAFRQVCARTPACARRAGSTMAQLRKVLDIVRTSPITRRVHGADGARRPRHQVTVDARTLTYVAFGATYVPTTYRELDAALRATLRGRPAALLRLVAEAYYPGGGIDDPVDYSEGADAAVSCQDYPTLYDRSVAPAERTAQYEAAIVAREQSHPKTYGPFTVRDYLGSDWEFASWCLQWPSAPDAYRQGPIVPPEPYSPKVPVLVISGEHDSITTAAEGEIVAGQWPRSQHVVVANSYHVNAVGDTEDCAVQILRTFVEHPRRTVPRSVTSCAEQVPPLRATPAFRSRSAQAPPATPITGTTSRARLSDVTTAAETVADVIDRWYQSYAVTGRGLHGGTFRMSGYDTVRFTLRRVRLVKDLAVSGRVTWDRYAHTVRVDLRIGTGSHGHGRLSGTWDTRAEGARAVLTGRLGGRPVHARLPAP